MTSEVALMNKHAVALAADSATTVTYWNEGKRERRYFKGANKIFNLSPPRPVGLMTYAAANLNGVPWEIVVKAFRSSPEDRAHSHLQGYATALFEYLQNNSNLFPQDLLEKQFRTLVMNAIARTRFQCVFQNGAPIPQEQWKAKWDEHRKEVDGSPFLGNLTQDDEKKALLRFSKETEEALKPDMIASSSLKPWIDAIGVSRVVEDAIKTIFREGTGALEKTGLLFAGFGEDEFFPSALHYHCYGIVLGKIVYKEDEKRLVNHEEVAQIIPLAQTEMVDTFVNGISIDALTHMKLTFAKSIDDFERSACTAEDRELLKGQIAEKFLEDMFKYMLDSHVTPMRRVVGNLPVDELAELAETLIAIESLKERVTRPSESVSGPVDVAVISKGEGFIWIKRKHYFDPRLNPRYIATVRGDRAE